MTVCPPLLYLLSMALTACRAATQRQTLTPFIPRFRPGRGALNTRQDSGRARAGTSLFFFFSVILLREHTVA